MKREKNNYDFFISPVTEVGDPRSAKGVRETGLPHIPSTGDGIVENAEPVLGDGKLKKSLKIAAIIAAVAVFIGIGIAIFLELGPDFFKIQPSINP